MATPVLSFRSDSNPATVLTEVDLGMAQQYDSLMLPVNDGEASDEYYLRIYNNYALAAGISDLQNVRITTYDSAVSQAETQGAVITQWIQAQQVGYGGGATNQAGRTNIQAKDNNWQSIGGAASAYILPYGSDGSTTPVIKGSGGNMGYVRLKFRVRVPAGQPAGDYAIGLWVTGDYV